MNGREHASLESVLGKSMCRVHLSGDRAQGLPPLWGMPLSFAPIKKVNSLFYENGWDSRFSHPFSFLLPPRFKLHAVSLKYYRVVGVFVVNIRIRTHPIGRIPSTLRHRPQVRRSLASVGCLHHLIVETAAGILTLPPGC